MNPNAVAPFDPAAVSPPLSVEVQLILDMISLKFHIHHHCSWSGDMGYSLLQKGVNRLEAQEKKYSMK